MSSFPLPIRPAVPPQQRQHQEQQPQPEPPPPPPAAVASDPLPSIDEEGPAPVSPGPAAVSPRPVAVETIISQVAKWVDTTSDLQPSNTHQFWVNDSSIAENLFTVSLIVWIILPNHLLRCHAPSALGNVQSC